MSHKEYEAYIYSEVLKAADIPAELPVQENLGESNFGLMGPQQQYASSHPAFPLLNGYAKNGCPVDCGPNWPPAQVEVLLRRDPHQSALVRKAVIQL